MESRRLALLPWFMLLLSCGGGTGAPSPAPLALRVVDARGWTPARFEVRVDANPEQVLRADCGGAGGANEGLACTATGATVLGVNPGAGVTIRSRGLRFAQTALAAGETSVVLEDLPADEVKADFRTGFPAEDGLEAFLSLSFDTFEETGATHVVKFFLDDMVGSRKVYFQNTRTHPVHYDFVRNVLGRAVTQEEFEKDTYLSPKRNMAGSVILRSDLALDTGGAMAPAPITLEFFPSDHLTPEDASVAYNAVLERIGFAPIGDGDHRLFYLPPGSVQVAQASASSHTLEAAGVDWLKPEAIYADAQIQFLNPGTAFGTLRVLTPEQLDEAAVSFRDVLVLPRLPNELPIVGGTITGELQTPLAHVNVAARARGTPNMALIGAVSDPRIVPLVGKLVRLQVMTGKFTLVETTPSEAQAFWDAQAQHEKLTPKADLAREGLAGFDAIGCKDALAFGAKAANLAEMSHFTKGVSPPGFAVPFHYHDAFQSASTVTAGDVDAVGTACLEAKRPATTCDRVKSLLRPEGDETLAAVQARVIDDPAFRTESELRFATLAAIRDLYGRIPVDPEFGATLDATVRDLIPEGTKVRLRSSTNAEDLPDFSGAGLYTSVSATGSGPDAASRRIREVWASVWNWQAYEERAFWNIDHLAVRMGVGVHESFPDEKANGVLITRNLADPMVPGMYVNVQKGEVSVTNPANGALPEVFTILSAPGEGIQIARLRYSSLSPAQPILSDAETGALFLAAWNISNHFSGQACYKTPYTYDMEFKFHGPERRLVLKQVRPYFEKP